MEDLQERGFTLMEASVTVGILGLLLAGGAVLVSQQLNASREDETIARLTMVRRALAGDPRIVTKEARTDFGFVGDMGSLPATLENLWIAGAQPLFAFDNTLKLGGGWQGPYVNVGPAGFFNQIALDGWGNRIQYVVETATSAATGQQFRARIFSYGPDGNVGGGDDLTTEIYTTEMLSTVIGFVRDADGNTLAGVSVKINYPTSGNLVMTATQTDSAGAFSFANIPFGNRSLLLEPKLVYVQGTGITTGGAGNNVEFVVQNFASTNVTINSFKAEYDLPAFYETLVIGGKTVFDFNNAGGVRAASGQTLTFASQPITVVGTGSISGQAFPVRIQSPFTQVPDQFVGQSARKGGNVRIQMKNFKGAQTGAAANVDMTGISFRATFSDGSVAIFTPVPK